MAQGRAPGLGLGTGASPLASESLAGTPAYGHATIHHHLLPSLGRFRDLQVPGNTDLECYGLPTPEMSPLDVLEEGAGESVFFPHHMQEEIGMGSWSGYQHHLHPPNQHYSHPYNSSHTHLSSMHGQAPALSTGATLSSTLHSSARVDSRMASAESNMTSGLSSITFLASSVNSRLNPAQASNHHVALRSSVKSLPSLSDCPSAVTYSQPTISLSEQIKSHQPPLSSGPVGYFPQVYGSSGRTTFTHSHLGQLSPPPETSPSCCSSSSMAPSSFLSNEHLEPPNPEASSHLGSSSAEFWCEVDRHEFDQYVNMGKNRDETFGLGGSYGCGSKVLGGHSNGVVSSIIGGGECDDGSSTLISALSDASSAVYYSTCITG